MNNYNYYRDAWPRIVRQCFSSGGRMFVVEEQRDPLGKVIKYEQGRELDEQEALEYRGATVEVHE